MVIVICYCLSIPLSQMPVVPMPHPVVPLPDDDDDDDDVMFQVIDRTSCASAIAATHNVAGTPSDLSVMRDTGTPVLHARTNAVTSSFPFVNARVFIMSCPVICVHRFVGTTHSTLPLCLYYYTRRHICPNYSACIRLVHTLYVHVVIGKG
jgi:hypothetical protein